MSEISEKELTESFVEDIATYPFKTHIQREVTCECGRIDLVLPDYNIAIEVKSAGDVKKAIGQALTYSEVTEMFGYVLLPVSKISDWVVSACKRANVGILTTTKTSLNFAVVNDVGGLESFHPNEYANVSLSDEIGLDSRSQEVVGGLD